MSYNWDLIQRLLHEVQASANDTFKPRRYAEEHAAQLESEGKPMPNLDSLRAEAADYESLLFEGGFIVARPEEQGGNGENFVLTERESGCWGCSTTRRPQEPANGWPTRARPLWYRRCSTSWPLRGPEPATDGNPRRCTRRGSR